MATTKKIKTQNSNSKIILLIALVFAALGLYLLNQSHAETSGSNVARFLNYASAAQTAGVSPVTDFVGQIGSQTVSQVVPGSKLTYLVGGKDPIGSICYYLRAGNTKGVGTVANVQISAVSNVKKISLNVGADYQEFCVSSGNGTPVDFSVFNSSATNGPNVLVYQAVVHPGQTGQTQTSGKDNDD